MFDPITLAGVNPSLVLEMVGTIQRFQR